MTASADPVVAIEDDEAAAHDGEGAEDGGDRGEDAFSTDKAASEAGDA